MNIKPIKIKELKISLEENIKVIIKDTDVNQVIIATNKNKTTYKEDEVLKELYIHFYYLIKQMTETLNLYQQVEKTIYLIEQRKNDHYDHKTMRIVKNTENLKRIHDFDNKNFFNEIEIPLKDLNYIIYFIHELMKKTNNKERFNELKLLTLDLNHNIKYKESSYQLKELYDSLSFHKDEDVIFEYKGKYQTKEEIEQTMNKPSPIENHIEQIFNNLPKKIYIQFLSDTGEPQIVLGTLEKSISKSQTLFTNLLVINLDKTFEKNNNYKTKTTLFIKLTSITQIYSGDGFIKNEGLLNPSVKEMAYLNFSENKTY